MVSEEPCSLAPVPRAELNAVIEPPKPSGVLDLTKQKAAKNMKKKYCTLI